MSKVLKKINYLTFVIGILISFFAFAQSTVPAAPPAPTISVAPASYYPLDEALYLEGRSAPKIKIELYFEKPGSQPVRQSVESNANGEWFFGQKLELASGEWTVRGRAIGKDNLPSDWSNPRIIRSVVSGFSVGSLKIKYLPIIVVLSLIFLLGLGLLIYSLSRVRNIQRLELERKLEEKTQALEKTLREKEQEIAKIAVEQEFTDLRKEILEELDHFKKRRKGGEKLTMEEEEHYDNLLRRLRRAQEDVEKQISKI